MSIWNGLAFPRPFHREVEAPGSPFAEADAGPRFHSTAAGDLTDLPLMTIDGQATLDFDDAISLEECGGSPLPGGPYRGCGPFYQKRRFPGPGRPSSGAAPSTCRTSGSPCFPQSLAEGLCSLRLGEERPAISTLIRIYPNADIIDYEVVASRIRVAHQLTYFDVNQMADGHKELGLLHGIADAFQAPAFWPRGRCRSPCRKSASGSMRPARSR